jgi:hypothetical protein
MALPIIISIAPFVGFGCLALMVATEIHMARRDRALRNDKPTRPRRKPFDDPGGYAAHGDWPFVPSDLKVSHHARKDAS